MNIALKATLRFRSTLKPTSGFTLIELMVVLVISGVLAAIALPTFFNQVNKAKQVEAKTTLGTMNRAQQSYYLEHTDFADNIPRLGVGIQPGSSHYRYSISVSGGSNPYAVHHAESLQAGLKPYTGIAAIVEPGTGEAVMSTLLCESEAAKTGKATAPTRSTSAVSCATGTREVLR